MNLGWYNGTRCLCLTAGCLPVHNQICKIPCFIFFSLSLFGVKCLKQNLRENSTENILSSASRLLLHEGRLTLAGNGPKCLSSRRWLNRIMLCYGRAGMNLCDSIQADKEKANIQLVRGQEIPELPKGWVICMIVSCHIWIFNLPDAEEIRLTCLHLSLRGRVLLSSSRIWQKDIRKFRLSHTNCPTYPGTDVNKPHLSGTTSVKCCI